MTALKTFRLLVVGLLLLTGCTTHRAHRHDALHAHPLPTPRTSMPPRVPQVSRTLIRPPVTPSRTSVPDSVWDRLVACEAPGRGWRYGAPGVGIDPGYPYEGGPNMTHANWVAYGGLVYAPHAWGATREQQIEVARRILADQGPQAWPICGPRVGLTRENGAG